MLGCLFVFGCPALYLSHSLTVARIRHLISLEEERGEGEGGGEV